MRGRDFTDQDTAAAPPVAIVNEAFARAVWPGVDPLGQQFESDGPEGTIRVTVVGVAADARLMSISEPAEPYVYVPLAQRYSSRVNVLVKTSGTSAIPGAPFDDPGDEFEFAGDRSDGARRDHGAWA